jgi:hydrogenase maturation protein HypF
MQRLIIKIKGIVQGVGFRPFIYDLATKHHLNGSVLNNTTGVVIEIEGTQQDMDNFVSDIKRQAPPLSRIESIRIRKLPAKGYDRFTIEASVAQEGKSVLISSDVAVCDACLEELRDSADRRYRYPFINCTNCGPRFTIVKDVPYDRDKTTMHEFKMCPLCQEEYEDPANRRFHAQPNACPTCGPQVELVESSELRVVCQKQDAVNETIKLLKRGKIVAIKGLGGFHLACDARNEEAVTALRTRKYREDKPFAVMAKDVKSVRSFCHVNETEEKLLLSRRRPIVLLEKKSDSLIANTVAPGQKSYGVMLPYTPLHHLLLDRDAMRRTPTILVMTSGNRSDEPISYENEEALSRLRNIADYFLMNDREIHTRCDDTVTRCFDNEEMILRRARGYVPEPIELPFEAKEHILACGAELKNTFCVARDGYAFMSHHIGDLENLETLGSFEHGIEHFKGLFSVNPKIVAHDLHPEYLSTKYARKLKTLWRAGASPAPTIVNIQHHHATRKVIGVAFDGLGYGNDGTLWGGEFLVADFSGFERIGHFKYVRMPGGAQAIREPYRMAVSYLHDVYGRDAFDLGIEFTERIGMKKWRVLTNVIDKHINAPLVSSVGRLFDAVAALLGVRDTVNYEGQAAIEFEMIADSECSSHYDYDIKLKSSRSPASDMLIVDPARTFSGIIADIKSHTDASTISAKFHNTLASIVTDVVTRIGKTSGISEVCLSGGVFQNMLLLRNSVDKLRKAGFNVHLHHKVPPNDGGISLGQVAIAAKTVGSS